MSLLSWKIVNTNWSSFFVDELVREGIITCHWHANPKVARHDLLAHRSINHLGHTITSSLEILVTVLRKLVRCVQIERIIALFLKHLLTAVVQSRVLGNLHAFHWCLVDTYWQHTTQLAYVLMC